MLWEEETLIFSASSLHPLSAQSRFVEHKKVQKHLQIGGIRATDSFSCDLFTWLSEQHAVVVEYVTVSLSLGYGSCHQTAGHPQCAGGDKPYLRFRGFVNLTNNSFVKLCVR